METAVAIVFVCVCLLVGRAVELCLASQWNCLFTRTSNGTRRPWVRYVSGSLAKTLARVREHYLWATGTKSERGGKHLPTNVSYMSHQYRTTVLSTFALRLLWT